MIAIKHILVPTDFSEPSERALAMAVDLAKAFHARVTLLHVWSVPNTGYAEGLAWPIADIEKAAERALAELHGRVSNLLPGTEAKLMVGVEWQQILDAAMSGNVDLVVMGTHGRRGLPRLFLGSVAEKVVRLSPVPVMTVGGPHGAKT